MKKISLFLLVLFIMVSFLVSSVFAERNQYDRKVSPPAFCPTIVASNTMCGVGGNVATLVANSDRIGGKVINLSSHTVYVSRINTTSTTIVANGFELGPVDTAETTTSVSTVVATTTTVIVTVNGSTTTTTSEVTTSDVTTAATTTSAQNAVPNVFNFRDGNAVYTGALYFASEHTEVELEIDWIEINKN